MVDLFQFTASQSKTLLYYDGAMTQSILSGLAEAVEYLEVSDKTKSKVFALFVEIAQNIRYHSQEQIDWENHLTKIGCGTIMLREEGDKYEIIGGNVINQKQVEVIQFKIDYINSLNDLELNEFYRYAKKKSVNIDRRGADLGLIDIAWRSQQKLDYSFNKLSEDKYFYTLKSQVIKE